MIIMCPHCSELNRVPLEKRSNKPNCGTCKKALFTGQPIAMSLPQFERARIKSDQTLIVDCWADWCAPCKQFAPVFERAAEELDLEARFVKVDVQKEEALARVLNIQSIPTMLIFKEGKEVARTTGAMNLAEFTRWIAPHLEG